MELLKRKRNRLKGYDYSLNGSYFVTICTTNRNMLLWDVGADIIRPNKLPLSQYGLLVEMAITAIPSYYENIIVDKYCIMPNHVHMIVFIVSNEDGRIISAPTLSVIIGSMKRWVSKQVGILFWQRSYHDHIIRNEQDYQKIWQYIDENPMKWEEDCFYRQQTTYTEESRFVAQKYKLEFDLIALDGKAGTI